MLHNCRKGLHTPDRFHFEENMNRLRNTFSLSLVVISLLFGLAGLAHAQRRNDRDIRDALRTLSSKLDDFEQNARYQMQSSSSGSDEVSELSDNVRTLRDRVNEFQDNFERRRETRGDVEQIVSAANYVNQFLTANPQNRLVEDDWNAVRRQIERLGNNYGVTVRWNSNGAVQPAQNYPAPAMNNTQSVGLSGTYDLDMARSENIDDIVADTRLGGDQREDLRDKLEAPSQIAIDIRGSEVTLATSNASPITFTADGRDKTEQSPSGKTLRVRATLNGQNLVVSSLGGDTDYTITFTTLSNGKAMKVQRRITTDYLNQTVIAESIYNKTDTVAQLGIHPSGSSTTDPNGGYSDNDNSGSVSNGGAQGGGRGPVPATSRTGNFIVPNGVTISGTLENEINTKYSQNNDRFRMTVQSPNEYRGAIVEGYITNINRSGRISGQPSVTFNFERIRLKNGQTYDFAGNLLSVVDISGKSINADNEGSIRGGSQTKQTIKRSGIGGGIGAVIGAIAGGGKGAAIGAIIGAGGGAGTVAAQGQNDIRLIQGTTINVQSSSPMNVGPR